MFVLLTAAAPSFEKKSASPPVADPSAASTFFTTHPFTVGITRLFNTSCVTSQITSPVVESVIVTTGAVRAARTVPAPFQFEAQVWVVLLMLVSVAQFQ